MDFIPKPKKRPGNFSTDPDEDDATPVVNDPVVAAAMQEDQARKQAKKGGAPPPGKKPKKGLTLEQVEELEGGTIKESKVGMAASKRADRRKKKATAEGVDMLGLEELEDVEEALEQEEDDGMALEPFNLAKERAEGHFDEGGNYVENKEEDDPSMKDAWLTSDDAGVLSEAARRRVQEREASMAAAEAAPDITPRQTADLMRELTAILQPRETVNAALRRLRPSQPATKRVKKQEGKAKDGAEAAKQGKPAGDAGSFNQVTEAASTLMDAGELDIYSMFREALQARADEYPAENDDFDMFGEGPSSRSADEVAPADLESKNVAAEIPQASKSAPSESHPQVGKEGTDYASWPVKELARFLKERGVDPTGIVEKAELVAKVKEIAAQGPEGEQPQVPPGYAWDPHSNLYYNPEAGMYFDASGGSYFSASDGKWYAYDAASSRFVELPS